MNDLSRQTMKMTVTSTTVYKTPIRSMTMEPTASTSSDDTPTKVVKQLRRPLKAITGSVWRVCRLPQLVVAPDEGPLILQSTNIPLPSSAGSTILEKQSIIYPHNNSSSSASAMMPPVCNIAVDPRLYKGSIFAARRQAAELARRTQHEQNNEARYRVDVIRSRLEQSLPQLCQSPQQQHSASALPARCSRSTKFATTSSSSSEAPICQRRSFLPPAVSIDKGIRVRNLPQLKRTENNRLKHVRIRDSPPSVLPTPPPSARLQYLIVDSSVQTEDTLDAEVSLLARNLTTTAILQALENLNYEQQVTEFKSQAADAMTMLEQERLLKSEEEQKLYRKLQEKERELEECIERSKQVIASKELAVKTCKEVTDVSLSKIQELERKHPKTKSVAIETRQMNRTQQKIDLVTIELEKDFFPWLFAQAEYISKQQLAASRLENVASNKEQSISKSKFRSSHVR